ncbi:uncharacterized protein LOC143286921 [Babylonia areolata]|uniref:uncharacterized protein LOC143286921 n=1 Tax=Babylonia areolata TaxID=304850 RepID=UPI003FCF1EF4
MAPKITDLEELIKIWAWDTFLRTRQKDHSKLQYNDVRLEVNWSRLKMTSSSPEYSDQQFVEKPQSQVVFRSTYENLTESPQDHSFHTERTTVSSCTTSVSKGFSKGMHLEVKLGLPDEVAGATAGFGREVNMESTDESTREEIMTWSINSNIKVPGHHRTIAELVVHEKQFSAKFKVSVQIKGQVLVVVTNLKDNNSFVQSIEGDFSEIMKTLSDKVDPKTVTFDKRMVRWEMEGTCCFRFGVEQRVKLREYPLEPNGLSECSTEH